MTDPLVSVVMPVRDGAAHLAQAVASLRAQTLAAIEIVIVDDGSGDATPALLAGFAADDARIRVETQGRLGIVAALDRGLALARGRYVARMDADDVALPHRLAAQAAWLEAHPEAAALGSAYRVIDEAGREGALVTPPTEPAAIRAALARQNCMAHPTVMMRRAMLVASGAYRPAFAGCEDYDLWLRLSERHDLANLAQPLLLYRVHGGQTTGRDLEARLVAEVGALHAARLRRLGRPDFGDGLDAVTPAVLRDAGLPASAFRAALRERALLAGGSALAAGDRACARAALAIAGRQGLMAPRAALRFARLLAGLALPTRLRPEVAR